MTVVICSLGGGYRPEHGEDVSRTGGVLAAVQSGSKLAQRLQEVQVVASHKVLGQTNNGHHQRGLKGERFSI